MNLSIKKIPAIDWLGLESFLGAKEWDPEGLVHELCHAYDCIGAKAFDKIGLQKDVDELIKKKYIIGSLSYNVSEIRITALTLLVMETFGHMTLLDSIQSMQGNLDQAFHQKCPVEKQLVMLVSFLGNKNIKETAKCIREFVLTFALE